MGGYGSGRWGSHVKKDTVEDCRVLDASRWTREKFFREDARVSGMWQWTDASTGEERSALGYEVNAAAEPPYARLRYSLTRTGENLDYQISLERTRPRLGGKRWWFICPLVTNGGACGRRVGKLYLPPGGKYYGCRHCYSLTYESAQTSNHLMERLMRYGGLENLMRTVRSR